MSNISMAEERIAFLQRTIIERDVEVQKHKKEIERLSELSVNLREDYLHMMLRVRGARDLLSGEFYAEALGELDDVVNLEPSGRQA